MKNLKRISGLFVIAIFGYLSFSCSDKEATIAPTDATITGIAKTDANLSILVQKL